ncbi:cuticle protein 7-like [Palaemon carinicauda]|uniref:cuticle protein 7-like n=1 Tax=Palaemon carinicauda TaxID=392227 RepID=UPI0035B58C10
MLTIPLFLSPQVLIASCCLVALAVGRPDDSPAPEGYGYAAPDHQLSYGHQENHEKGMPFDFEYAVKDDYKGLDFGHDSKSDGKVVTGKYYVLLPDGRTQIVTYTADHYNGYQAEVTYEGEAKPYHPAPSYDAPKPTYGAPEPTYKEPTPVYGTSAPTYEEPKALYGAPDH